jgi:oxazoline/thiazoline dehydrogenase
LSAFLRLLWRPGVSASANDDGALIVEGLQSRVALRSVTPAFRQAFLRLAPPGDSEENLVNLVADGNGALARWYYLLQNLTRRGMVCYALHTDGARLATLVPISPAFVAQPIRPLAQERYVLSRFAYLRRDGADAVLESPLAHARIVLNDRRLAALVGCLSNPVSPGELAEQCPGTSPEATAGVLSLLSQAGMLLEADRAGATTEDRDANLQTWPFHDLLFHARSRLGRSDAAYGATYRFAGKTAPSPALKTPPPGEVFELYRPDLQRLECDDPPLAYVQERRCSVRSFDRECPVTDRQLGEFLFRVARARISGKLKLPRRRGPARSR